MFACPNKSYKSNPNQAKSDWQMLVDRVGSEDNAYLEYVKNNFDIPIVDSKVVDQAVASRTKINLLKKTMDTLLITNTGFTRYEISPVDARLIMSKLAKAGFGHLTLLKMPHSDYYVLKDGKKTVNSDYLNNTNNFLFQLEASNEPANADINEHMKKLLARLGVKYENVGIIYDSNGEEVSAIAKADFLHKVVQVVEGKIGIDTLPEEAFHFITMLMGKDNPIYKTLANNIVKLPEYQEVKNSEYASLYKGNEEAMKMEAIGKVLAKEMVRLWKEDKLEKPITGFKPIDIVLRAVQRAWQWMHSKFKTEMTSDDIMESLKPFIEVAKAVKEGNLEQLGLEETIDTIPDDTRRINELYAILRRDAARTEVLNKLAHDSKIFVKKLLDNTMIPKGIIPDPSGQTERYWDTENNRFVKWRVTDLVNMAFIKKLGRWRAEQINEIPDNKLKAEVGTRIHATAEAIILKVLLNQGYGNKQYKHLAVPAGKTDMDWLAIRNMSGLNQLQFDTVLVPQVIKLLDFIEEMQESIDPNGKCDVFAEQMVYSQREDRGGTVDLLAVFSDKSFGKFDFKNVFPSYKYLDKTTHKLAEDPIEEYKYNSYNMQLSSYKKTLQNEYGLGQMRFARIVPIHIQLGIKDKSVRKPGDNYTNTVTTIEMGQDMNPHLKHRAVAGEETDDAGLNKLAKSLDATIGVLEDQLKRAPREKKAGIRAEIKRTRKAYIDVLVNKDIKATLDNIGSLLSFLNGKDGMGGALGEVETVIDGKPNPKYISDAEFLRYRATLQSYRSLPTFMSEHINNLSKGTEAQKKQAATLKVLVQQYVGRIETTIADMDRILMEKFVALAEEKGVNPNAKNYAMDPVASLLIPLSEQEDAYLKTMHLSFQDAQIKIAKKQEEFADELTKHQTAVEAWAKTQGIAKDKIIDKLRNVKTMNMYSRLTQEFWKEYENAFKIGDAKWIKQHMQLKKNWQEIYNRAYEAKKRQLELEIQPVEGLYTEEQAVGYRAKKLDEWVKSNNVNSEAFWGSPDIRFYLELKPEVYTQYMSPEFAYINQHKPLLDFYEFIEKFNEYAEDVTGQGLAKNLLPKVHKHMVEMVVNGDLKLSEIKSELLNTLKITEEDIAINAIDPNTGLPRKYIPMYFTDAIRSENGEIVVGAHSNDIFKMMYMFAKVVHNFECMQDIQTNMEIVKEAIALNREGEIILNSKGHVVKDYAGRALKKMGLATTKLGFAEDAINHFIYGIDITNKGVTSKKGYNSNKIIQSLQKLTTLNGMAFRVITPLAAFGAIQANMAAEKIKGTWFDAESVAKVRKEMMTRDGIRMQRALGQFVHAYQERGYNRIANKFSIRKASRFMSMDFAMATYRKVDEYSDDKVTNYVLNSWGIGTDPVTGKPKLRRIDVLKKKDPNAKTLRELVTYNEKEDEITIDGLTDDLYRDLREIVKKAGSAIKGNMSEEDYYRYRNSIYGRMIMAFKNWMPGVVYEKGRGITYDSKFEVAQQGRYKAFASNFRSFSKEEKEELTQRILSMGEITEEDVERFMNDHILKRMGRMIADIVTLGKYKYEFDETRARILYEEHLEARNLTREEFPFEAFYRMKVGQTRAALAELRAALGLALAIIGLGSSWGADDKKKLYQRLWATRKLYSILQRSQTEVMFAYDPTQFMQLLRTPIPLVGTFELAIKTVQNTFDETRDLVFGENSRQDKTPLGYYSTRWIPGAIEVRRMFELLPQDRQAQFK